MKKIILGLLFVIGMMVSAKAQERAVQKKVQDLVGTLSLPETTQLESAIGLIKTKKNWDVILYTYVQPSPQVILNAPSAAAVGTRKILVVIPEDSENPEIYTSKDLEGEIFPDDIERIKKSIIMPKLSIGQRFQAKLDGILALGEETKGIDVNFFKSDYDTSGFDDSKDNKGKEITYYPSYQTILYDGKKKPVIWKTLRKDVKDALGITLKNATIDKVFLDFDASKFNTPPPLKPTKTYYAFDLKSAIGDDNFDNAISISAHLNKKDGDKVAQCWAYSLKPKTVKLAVIIVDEKNDDVQAIEFGKEATKSDIACITAGSDGVLDSSPMGDDKIYTYPDGRKSIIVGANKKCNTKVANDICPSPSYSQSDFKKYLDERYGQINTTWEVSLIAEHIAIDYDTDTDKKFNDQTIDDSSKEEKIVTNYIKAKPEYDTKYDKIIFFFKNIGLIKSASGLSEVLGYTRQENQYVFQIINELDGTISNMPRLTSAHELGHTLSLDDLTTQFSTATDEDDPENIMTYSSKRTDTFPTKFRKFQWEEMREYMEGKFD